MPILFNILPAIIILALNITLWCYIRHYTRMSQVALNNINDAGSNVMAMRQINEPATALTQNGFNHHLLSSNNVQTNNNKRRVGSALSYSSLIAFSKSRDTRIQNSYNVTIIVLCFWLMATSIPYYIFQALTLIVNDERSGGGHYFIPIARHLTRVLLNVNHFIDIFIYLLFHKEFRTNLFRMAYQVRFFVCKIWFKLLKLLTSRILYMVNLLI